MACTDQKFLCLGQDRGPFFLSNKGTMEMETLARYPEAGMFRRHTLVGSCRGLVCLGEWMFEFGLLYALLLWNPTTHKIRKVQRPRPPIINAAMTSVGFGYDNDEKGFVMVILDQLLMDSEFQIQVLRTNIDSEGLWSVYNIKWCEFSLRRRESDFMLKEEPYWVVRMNVQSRDTGVVRFNFNRCNFQRWRLSYPDLNANTHTLVNWGENFAALTGDGCFLKIYTSTTDEGGIQWVSRFCINLNQEIFFESNHRFLSSTDSSFHFNQ